MQGDKASLHRREVLLPERRQPSVETARRLTLKDSLPLLAVCLDPSFDFRLRFRRGGNLTTAGAGVLCPKAAIPKAISTRRNSKRKPELCAMIPRSQA